MRKLPRILLFFCLGAAVFGFVRFGTSAASSSGSNRPDTKSSASGTQPAAPAAAPAPPQNPKWPSVEEQLKHAGARPGTAFERLIRENQDFAKLRASEVSDVRGLPVWLRVWWRKQHPELTYLPLEQDATGGYPLVLKEIYEWMQFHQDLQAGKREPDIPAGKPSFGTNASLSGANTSVSGTKPNPQSESYIQVNYTNPNLVLCASNNIQAGGAQGQYFSTDGGASWGRTTLPFTGTDTSHSDPTVDWSSDGRAWSSTLGIQGGNLRGRNYVSTNNGATWAFDSTFSGTQTSVDKQIVWIDHHASSPFRNNQYVIYHNGLPAFMNRRQAAGSAFDATPIQVSGGESTGTAIGADVKTNSAGDVFGFWPTTGNARIFVVKSTNGGTSYGTPVQIATTFDTFDIGVPSFNSRRALIYVSGGCYRSGATNDVYAAWTDLNQAGAEPGSNVASTQKTRIWFSRSTDGGATWSAKAMINNQASLNDQYNQWLAVDETNGNIGIMYYDTVADAGRRKTHVYYQSSNNGGLTWTAPLQVTTADTDESVAGAESGNQYGDYNGLTGNAGVFFPSWTDRRTGINPSNREEIYTQKILDNAAPTPNIVGAGSSIVSESCTPNNGVIDPGETVTVSLCLQNTGTLDSTVTGTLQATGGVTSPSGAQSYGNLVAGGPSACRNFTFTASGSCGAVITATLAVTGSNGVNTTATYTFQTGTLTNLFSENFDGVTAPSLPAGWTTNVTGAGTAWGTTATGADSAPNVAFVNGVTTTGSSELVTPSISLPAGPSGATLNFRHAWNFENTSTAFDGGVLEVSVGGGPFNDILTAGGTFAAGGYTGTISTCCSNPLAGRQGWTNQNTSFITTTVNLPASMNGQNVQFRWRGGWDFSTSATNPNWRVDGVTVQTRTCCAGGGGGPKCGDTLTSLLAADTTNNRVQKFDGTNWTVLMPSGIAVGRVTAPKGVTQTTDGLTVYVAEANRIQKSTDGGTTWAVVSTGPGLGLTQVNAPAAVAVKPDDGNFVAVCDTGNHRVKLSTDGGTTWTVLAPTGTTATTSGVTSPQGVVVGCDGSVYIADTGNNRILYFAGPTPTAGTGVIIANNAPPTGLNRVNAPRGVAIDNATGDVYVADTGNGRVVRYTGPVTAAVAAANCTLVFGTGSLNAGQVVAPHGVSVSNVGGGLKLFVSDGNLATSRILRTTNLTTFTPFAQVNGALAGQTGGFGSLLGQFRSPAHIR